MTSPYITYDSATLTYHIAVGASASDIALVAKDAPAGATLLLGAGEHVFHERLYIDRGDLTFRGVSREETTIVITHNDGEGIRFDNDDPVWQTTLSQDVTQGSKTLVLPVGYNVQAGEVLGLHMKNDDSLMALGDYGRVDEKSYWKTSSLRESLVEVDHVVGNTA